MDNNFDNIPEEEKKDVRPVYTDPNADAEDNVQPASTEPDAPESEVKEDPHPVYTDPNADVKEEDIVSTQTAYEYTQSTSDNAQNYAGYQQGTPNQSGQSGPYSYQNSSYQYQGQQNTNYQYQNTQNNNYQYQDSQSTNNQYQDNLNYNIGNNMGYNQNSYGNMDTSPLSMGDWLLTILAAMIPCAGLILYIVWAFSSTGNINRRNFCRAQLIIMAVVFVLYLILIMVFGAAYLSM